MFWTEKSDYVMAHGDANNFFFILSQFQVSWEGKTEILGERWFSSSLL